MPYPSSQRNLSASQADFPSSHFGVAIAPDLTIALLTARINTLCTQIVEMQTRLKELEEMAYPIDRRYRAPDPENTVYSPIVKLSFKAMKLLFLFLAGFLLVYVLAGSLGVRSKSWMCCKFCCRFG